ncbi:hypothetical protein RND71_023045 [Anisodus tanguticus]|uniref:Uncharacterized protein n=1 Tax=Anisodus tanguticus TaxID=243964 RepID=A0AAE1RTP0_9SOLA|nr:hypothetical protein RND71_023045 [Anisodus tanguticus]
MATKYFNFRCKIDGILVSEVEHTFVRGRTEHSFNIDFDHLSIPELVDLAKEFGDTGPTRQHVTGGVIGNLSQPSGDRKSANLFIHYPSLLNTTLTTDLDVGNSSFPNSFGYGEENIEDEQEKDAANGEAEAENYTSDIENSSSKEGVVNESDSELSDDYRSDVYEELREVREDLREYKNNKVVNVVAKEKIYGVLGKARVDEGYEYIDRARTNLRDKLGGDDDEPYYDSSDVDSFATESEGEAVSDDDEVEGETELKAMRKSDRVVRLCMIQIVTKLFDRLVKSLKM